MDKLKYFLTLGSFFPINLFFNSNKEAGETTQKLTVFAILTEDRSLVPNTHMLAHRVTGSLGTRHTCGTHVCELANIIFILISIFFSILILMQLH